MLKVFKFEIWENNKPGFREVLVIAENQDEAEDKLTDSGLDYDDYKCEDSKIYESVII